MLHDEIEPLINKVSSLSRTISELMVNQSKLPNLSENISALAYQLQFLEDLKAGVAIIDEEQLNKKIKLIKETIDITENSISSND
ncbi:hypothetical protein NMS01_003386 [Vibrio cholerae]|uniref:hypothetical protein n=1 Tax=Vibrio cholerae TaxID=666 RepID=UPI000E67A086|nr:hypothetical protein [Vibrio cholerae]EGQ8013368.1 hypothetical protein [Vibrio cholerae]EJL6679579.1 hypothetical protein [Vibrio cholerae]EJL6709882.1 hypothetical protein [Vibrio cholerae]